MKKYEEMKAFRNNRDDGDAHTKDFNIALKCKLNSKANEYGVFVEYYNKHVYDSPQWQLSDFMKDDDAFVLESGNEVSSVIMTKSEYIKLFSEKTNKLKFNTDKTAIGIQVPWVEINRKVEKKQFQSIDRKKSFKQFKSLITQHCEKKI